MYVQNINNQISIILLYVDDILIVSKTEADLMKIKLKLYSSSKLMILGNNLGFSEYNLNEKRVLLKINKSRYIKKILSKFYMADYKPCSSHVKWI